MLYRDLDLKMRGHPVKQDLFWVTDAQAVSNSIKMLINTNFYERPFNSDMGANLRALLFELADEDTEGVAKDRAKRAIERWEPRAVIESISSRLIEHTITVQIRFRLVNSSTVNTTTIALRVLR